MDNTLFMLADPKKTRKIKQSNIDTFVNNYELHKNNAFEINNSDSQSEIESLSEVESDNESIIENNFSEEFNVIIEHFNSIDTYILNNNNNEELEIINNYLIDLLFLNKSKKSKK